MYYDICLNNEVPPAIMNVCIDTYMYVCMYVRTYLCIDDGNEYNGIHNSSSSSSSSSIHNSSSSSSIIISSSR